METNFPSAESQDREMNWSGKVSYLIYGYHAYVHYHFEIEESENMKILILNRQQVKKLLPMRACMDVLANTFRAYSRGESVQPLRTMMKVPGSGGILAPMPGYDGVRLKH